MKANNFTKLVSTLLIGLSLLTAALPSAQASAPSSMSRNKKAIVLGAAAGIFGVIAAGFAICGSNGSSPNPALAPASTPAPAPTSSDKAITDYSINVEGATTEINGQTITVTVPRSADLTSQPFIATFTTTGTSVAIGSAAQTSGVTPVTFPSDTYSLTYTVTAADGSTVDYTVKVAAKLYTIAYDPNGGTGRIPSVSYTSDAAFSLPDDTGFNPPGQDEEFYKWNTAADGTGVAYNPDDPFTVPAQDTILYAIWHLVG